MNDELDKLAHAWIRLYEITRELGGKSPERDAYFWAFEKLDSICRKEPIVALGVITDILHLSDNEFVHENLAAGPLEDLLVRHGSTIIASIEATATSDAKFRELLGLVWQNAITDDVWSRVKSVAGKSTRH